MIFQANGELPERVRGLGCRRGNGKAVLYIRGQHPRNGIVLRRDDSRVDAAASAKIPREVKWPVNGQTVSLDTTSLLKHHYIMFAHRLRMMKRMCAFILFILYFQVRFEVFKRNKFIHCAYNIFRHILTFADWSVRPVQKCGAQYNKKE